MAQFGKNTQGYLAHKVVTPYAKCPPSTTQNKICMHWGGGVPLVGLLALVLVLNLGCIKHQHQHQHQYGKIEKTRRQKIKKLKKTGQ